MENRNKLYCGDNLNWLTDPNHFPSGTVDLIYLDPPFQSGKNYNVIFQTEARKVDGATSQIEAFKDTWNWGEEAETTYQELIKENSNSKLITLMKAMRGYLGECSLMAYLCMMAPRLLEMKRVMKETASIYLHCDPTACHYLKILMDAVFGSKNFKNEIAWERGTSSGYKSKGSKFVDNHDIILMYCKDDGAYFKRQFLPYSKEYIKWFKHDDGDGRLYLIQPPNRKQYLDESPGVPISDLWTDIKSLQYLGSKRMS